VDRLRLRWFFNTRDVVTATPAVVDGTVYVGDWSGRFYALRARDGKTRWTFTAKPERLVYSGQIVASAAVAVVGGVRTVFFASGKTMYALRASDGTERWRHTMGRKGAADDPTEIESSPVVAGGLVIFGFDVHNSGKGSTRDRGARRPHRAAAQLVTAPSTGDGATGAGAVTSGARPQTAGPVTSAPGLHQPDRWGRFSDAMVAVDLATGALRWTFQPHQSNRDDLDFAGAPNLMTVDGRALAGLGSKDGTYYIVDRTTGARVSAAPATGPGLPRPGGNFSTGGFIGPAAYRDGIVVGGTAVGPPPYLHGIEVPTGHPLQNQEQRDLRRERVVTTSRSSGNGLTLGRRRKVGSEGRSR
jgi:polyvinyl alcohol dehydrogenase (cytochrome)